MKDGEACLLKNCGGPGKRSKWSGSSRGIKGVEGAIFWLFWVGKKKSTKHGEKSEISRLEADRKNTSTIVQQMARGRNPTPAGKTMGEREKRCPRKLSP